MMGVGTMVVMLMWMHLVSTSDSWRISQAGRLREEKTLREGRRLACMDTNDVLAAVYSSPCRENEGEEEGSGVGGGRMAAACRLGQLTSKVVSLVYLCHIQI